MAKKEGAETTTTAVATAISAAETLDNKIVLKGAVRRKLPKVRTSRTYKFRVADLKGYFTVGEYEDGTPGELFVVVSKQGSTLAGLMDSFATAMSYGLQYGVPLKSYIKTLMSRSFPPAGITDDNEIRTASSMTDYIMRRLALDYLSFDDRLELGLASLDDNPELQTTLLTDDQSVGGQITAESEQPIEQVTVIAEVDVAVPASASNHDGTAPLCYNCGNQTQRAGSCYVCTSCGSTTGCS